MEKNDRETNLELCFYECYGVLKTLAYKYRKIYNGDVDEAFSNACLWLVELYDSFDKNKSNFISYVYTIVSRKFINEGKKKFNERNVFINISFEELEEGGKFMGDSDTFNTNEQDRDSKMGLRNRENFYTECFGKMDDIKERDVQIFELFYSHGWSIKDIAIVFKLSEVRVKEIKRNIVKKIESR